MTVQIDTGNTAFMLISASLVMLMTPGLAFFYGGLVGRKNVLTIMIQSFVSMAIVDVIWFVVGFSLCFGGLNNGGVYGSFQYVFLNNISLTTPATGLDPTIPLYSFLVYQMMFAIITPALISGAFTNRVSFKAYIIFLVFWSLFVYFPFVHMVWGGGLLHAWGVEDFAGGIVVHVLAGFAALASVFFVGARIVKDKAPHNVPLVALGTGLLWFGWYGFNAGSALTVNSITVIAFLNTDLAASVAATVWLAMAWIFEKKPKFLGLLTGAVAGLATITPAAGYVTPQSAMIIGMLAGVVCYAAIFVKNHMHWDDALDVWGVHGVGGALGAVSVGIFGAAAVSGSNGLLAGGTHLFEVQLAAVAIGILWAFGFTYLMLWLIDKVTPVRVSSSVEEMGLDAGIHGEVAYEMEEPAIPEPAAAASPRTDSSSP